MTRQAKIGSDSASANMGVDIDVCAAARQGWLGHIKMAIDARYDLNQIEDGMTPLMHAAYNFNAEAFSALLAGGADPSIKGDQGETALHLCAGNGWANLCKDIIELGCDVNAKTDTQSTPLHYWAGKSSDRATCAVLVQAGADLMALDKDLQDPLGRATYWDRGAATGLRESTVKAAKLLIAYGSPTNQAPSGMEGLSMVRAAAQCGATERVLELLEKPHFLDPADTHAAVAKDAMDNGHPETAAAIQAFEAHQTLQSIRSKARKNLAI